MANEYTLGGPPPQSRSEKILMSQNPGPAQSRIEELLKNSSSGRVSGAMVYKGTVETTLSLPSDGNEPGDIYHVNADGSEWAWNGSTWEELGKTVDLSAYAEKTWVQNQGYQTAPFEIEITESGMTFSTTATAQEILDNAGNCVAVLRDGAEVIKPDFIARNGSTAVSILFTVGIVATGLGVTQIAVTAENGNVTVQGSSTQFTPLPDATNASVGDFLRLDSQKQVVWQTVQTYQGGNY